MQNIADRFLRVPNNLPARINGFVGRERELAEAVGYLNDSQTRLLTLSGPGGVGKTRLGEQLVIAGGNEFSDGCFIVHLASISDPTLVISTIAGVLGVKENPGLSPIKNLADFLQEKQLLLLLDNFEQLTGATSLIAELLEATTKLKIIVTSREALRLVNERVLVVPPLDLPDLENLGSIHNFSEYSAVQLFVQQAQLVNATFELGAENGPIIAEICLRLDGLPLAMELAAARIKILTPKMLLARLSNRLKLLTGGAHNLPERQKTLRNAIEWSYELLEPAEKKILARLAIFVGSFDAASAQVVCYADIPEVMTNVSLETLAEKSLIQSLKQTEGGLRYKILSTIREYLLERLLQEGEEQAVKQRHAIYFQNIAEEAEPQLTGAEQLGWFRRLKLEENNLRAALSWALEGTDKADLEIGLRLSGALWRFWQLEGQLQEGQRWLEIALEKSRELPPGNDFIELRAKTLYAAGILARDLCEYVRSAQLINESLELQKRLGDKRGIANAYNTLGSIAAYQGNYLQSRWLHEESLALRRELGESRGIAVSLSNIAAVMNAIGEYAVARQYYQEALSILRELGDQRAVAHLLSNYAELLRLAKEFDRAKATFEESLHIRRSLGDNGGVASTLLGLGDIARELTEYDQALEYYGESLQLLKLTGDLRYATLCLVSIAGIQTSLGNPLVAIHLLGAAETLRQSIAFIFEPADLLAYEKLVGLLKQQIGHAEFEVAWIEGSQFPLERVFALALRDYITLKGSK